jgi:hypothetical protein
VSYLLLDHPLAQGALDQRRYHLREELDEHQSLNARVLLQPDRGDLERGFE